MSNVAINIAAEFKGKQAFDKAGKSVSALEKGVNKLGKRLVGVFAIAKLVQFGKSSVRAFSEAEKANTRLANSVDNLGLSLSKAKIQEGLDDLSAKYGIQGEPLAEAFQSLLQTTGSITKSQELLKLAIDASLGSGVDLAQVGKDISLAYVGQTRALRKYNLGLTQAELKTTGFLAITEKLQKQYGGAGSKFLDTNAGKMQVLAEAADNAKETIGAGLITALAKMSGGTEAKDAIKTINNIAAAINGITDAIGTTIGFFVKLYKSIDTFAKNIDPIFGDSWNQKNNKPRAARSASPAGTYRRMQEQKKAELEAIARNKKLAALERQKAQEALKALKAKKDQAALEKLSLLLKEGEEVFDREGVELAAAQKAQAEQLAKATNQGQLLAIANDMTRISIKKNLIELEKAIQAGDVEAAQAAAEKLNISIKQLGVLNGQQLKLADINKILSSMVSKDLINLANLNLAYEKIKQINDLMNNTSTDKTGWMNVSPAASADTALAAAENNAQLLLDLAAANEALVNQIASGSALANANKTIIELKLSGGDEVTNAIAKNMQNKSLSDGKIAELNRRTGFFL
jgi:hypothetical protein